jgi:hypothetical protein
MAQSAVDKIPPGPKLDASTAEKVFGWRMFTSMKVRMSVKKHGTMLISTSVLSKVPELNYWGRHDFLEFGHLTNSIFNRV